MEKKTERRGQRKRGKFFFKESFYVVVFQVSKTRNFQHPAVSVLLTVVLLLLLMLTDNFSCLVTHFYYSNNKWLRFTLFPVLRSIAVKNFNHKSEF